MTANVRQFDEVKSSIVMHDCVKGPRSCKILHLRSASLCANFFRADAIASECANLTVLMSCEREWKIARLTALCNCCHEFDSI